jgi:hypothetical protein
MVFGLVLSTKYTQRFNDFLLRSRHQLSDVFKCVTFIKGLPNFELQTEAKSYHFQHKDYNMPLVELQSFLIDLVTDSPHLDQEVSSLSGRDTQIKRPLDNFEVVAKKR